MGVKTFFILISAGIFFLLLALKGFLDIAEKGGAGPYKSWLEITIPFIIGSCWLLLLAYKFNKLSDKDIGHRVLKGGRKK